VPPLSQIQIINSYSNNGTFYFIGQLYGKLSEKESLRRKRKGDEVGEEVIRIL